MRLGLTRWWVWLAAGSVLLALGAAGASAAGPTPRETADQVTLTVTFAGTGEGLVETSPPSGIDCASVCSAQFPVNSGGVYLIARAVRTTSLLKGSTFAGWSSVSGSNCVPDTHAGLGANQCFMDLSGDTTIQATFNLEPWPCVAPAVKGRTLATAKQFIKAHRCRVGTITSAFSARWRKGRVIHQNPTAGWHRESGAIDLVISKGRR
jgi:hypothetical protein